METYNSPEKINQPEIIIENDQETGMQIFERELFDVDDQYRRNMILDRFERLRELDNAGSLTHEKAREFLEEIYKNNEEKINEVIEKSREIIAKRGMECLKTLARYMDYEWRIQDKYKAIPTLLAHSPFNGHTFYVSMYGPVLKNGKNEILDIAIHEISHFMLFQILKDLKMDQFNQAENKGLLHMFKEALTGMLLSEPKLGELLGNTEYRGNPETHHIFIQESESEPKLFQEFLREKFKQTKESGGDFNSFLVETIDLLLPQAVEFAKRKGMWNKYGRKIEKNPELLAEYREAIVI